MCVTVIPWVLGIDGIDAGFRQIQSSESGQFRSTDQGQDWGGSLAWVHPSASSLTSEPMAWRDPIAVTRGRLARGSSDEDVNTGRHLVELFPQSRVAHVPTQGGGFREVLRECGQSVRVMIAPGANPEARLTKALGKATSAAKQVHDTQGFGYGKTSPPRH
jgi:hypothetical protein